MELKRLQLLSSQRKPGSVEWLWSATSRAGGPQPPAPQPAAAAALQPPALPSAAPALPPAAASGMPQLAWAASVSSGSAAEGERCLPPPATRTAPVPADDGQSVASAWQHQARQQAGAWAAEQASQLPEPWLIDPGLLPELPAGAPPAEPPAAQPAQPRLQPPNSIADRFLRWLLVRLSAQCSAPWPLSCGVWLNHRPRPTRCTTLICVHILPPPPQAQPERSATSAECERWAKAKGFKYPAFA